MAFSINARRFVAAAGGKTLVIPKVWNRASFAAHGAAMIRTQYRVARLVQRRAVPIVAKIAKTVYDKQLRRIIEKVAGIHGARSAKAEVTFEIA